MKVTFKDNAGFVPDFVMQGADDLVMNEYNNCMAVMAERPLPLQVGPLTKLSEEVVDGTIVVKFNNGVTAVIDPQVNNHIHEEERK